MSARQVTRATIQPQRGEVRVPIAIVLERLPVAVRAPAVGLRDDPLVRPDEVALVAGDAVVDEGLWEAGAT